MTRKLISLLLVVLLIFVLVTHKTWFITTMKSGGDLAVIASVLFTALLVFFPVVPFIVAAGIIGSAYGTLDGTAITLTGAMIGTMVMFFLARFGFSTWAERQMDKYPQVKKYELYFESHAAFTVFVARLIPVIPTTLVNILSGVSKISSLSFFFASLLGKLPVNLLYNFAGGEMGKNRGLSFLVYGVYFTVAALLIGVYLWREKRKEA